MRPIWGGSFKRATKGNDSYTKLLLHMDGADESTTFTDSSASAHGNASVSGSVQVDTAQARFGASAQFVEATSDYMYYADHADWDLDSGTLGKFTIDFWIRFSNITADGTQTIISQYKDADEYWVFEFEEPSTFQFRQVTPAGAHDITVNQNYATTSINTWYHVALISGWRGNAGEFAICRDGIGPGLGDEPGEAISDFAANLNIGVLNPAGTANYLDGWIDELRISKGIARWTANFTPPPGPYW